MNPPSLVVYGGDDVGAAVLASGIANADTLWIRPPAPPLGFAVSYLGNGEVEAKARLIYGDEVTTRLWDLSRENLALQRRFLPGHAVPVHWQVDGTTREEEGWRATGAPALTAKVATLTSVSARGNFRYELFLETPTGPETLETSALVMADELLPPRFFAALKETWLLPGCTELVGKASASMPPGLTLEHAGVDYAIRVGNEARCGSFRGLQDDGSIARPLAPSPRGTAALQQYYGEQKQWLDGKGEARVYEAALSCDGLPVVGPLSEAPGIFVVGAFAARERNFRTAAVKAVLDGLAAKRSPLVEPYSPRRFA